MVCKGMPALRYSIYLTVIMPHEVLSTRAVDKLEVHLLITSEYSDLKEHSLPITLLRNIGNSANCEWVKV